MSRLYETLERISRAEQKKKAQDAVGQPVRQRVSHGEGRKWRGVWVVVAVSVLFVALLVSISLRWHTSPDFFNSILTLFHGTLENSRGIPGSEKAKVQKKVELMPQQPKRMVDAKGRAVELNNKAVKLLKKDAYWEALYLLDEAIKMAPRLEAPYYNTVYALIQLGYYGAAQEYCKRIWRLFGETEWVKRNRSALEDLGIHLDMVAMEAGGA